MPIEIEKKYRLRELQRDQIIARLAALNFPSSPTEFETNVIYRNSTLASENAIVRLRRVGDRSILAFKKRYTSTSAIKHQLEEETEVTDVEAMALILMHLGLSESLIYEKRRQTFHYAGTEIAIDELPFGFFMEIEGVEQDIEKAENELGIADLRAIEDTYPALTQKYGKRKGDVIEARF